MAFRALFLCGAATLALLLACKDDETKPPITDAVGSGTGGGSPTNDDASTPVGDSGTGVCSTATIMANVVDQQSVSANLPTATGGTIQDGTYDLEVDAIYVGAGGLGTPTGVSIASTLVITGNRFERLDRVVDASSVSTPSVQSGTFQLAGASGAIAFTCPLTLNEAFSFTAGIDAGSDGSLTFYRSTTNEARTYRRRL